MRIGFFGGSFNPPTIAHIKLCLDALDKCNLDKIYIVPVNDMYKKKNLISFKHRKKMIELAIKDVENIEISNIEEKIEDVIYAADIFEIIKNMYQNDDIYFLMGMDNYSKLNTWKDYSSLTKYKYIVFERDSDKSPDNIQTKDTIFLYSKDSNGKSSTIVRNLLQEGKDVSEYIDRDVEKYIRENYLYKL